MLFLYLYTYFKMIISYLDVLLDSNHVPHDRISFYFILRQQKYQFLTDIFCCLKMNKNEIGTYGICLYVCKSNKLYCKLSELFNRFLIM